MEFSILCMVTYHQHHRALKPNALADIYHGLLGGGFANVLNPYTYISDSDGL